MRVDVNLHSCDFEIRSTLSEILDAMQFYIFWLRISACLLHITWMCLDIIHVVATELWWYICSCKSKNGHLFIFVRMLQHCRIKTENEFQCVLFMYYNSYHKEFILMKIKKFSWLFKRNLPEVNVCMWEFGASHFTYTEILGTICDYVIWWELLNPGWDAICLQWQWEPVRMHLHRRMVSTRLVLNS